MPFVIEHPADPQIPVSRVEGDVLLIGRGTNAGLRLNDQSVALEHARIERDPAGYKLTDLGSVTGTYLNGKAVESAYLADGDTAGVGGWRLTARLRSPGEPLVLEARPVAGTAAKGAAAVPAREIDYVRAYTLRRPFLTKGSLAILLTLVALAAVIALPFSGALRAFQPGPISERHQREKVACFECHAPWQGPTAVTCSQKCHKRIDHQMRQAFTPACADCHFEHRGKDRLILVNDARCVVCHGDLKVKDGGTPAFARTVESFPERHADFSITLAGGRRLPVADAAAQRADPGTVRLNHAFHLKPGLNNGSTGRETLSCGSCHQPGDGPTGMAPVRFEQHCQRCHRLTFDDRRPDEDAPHTEPRTVHDRLVAIYGVDERQMGTFQERRRNTFRNPGSEMGIRLTAGVRAQVEEAESHLYRVNCVKCHEMDLNASPFPRVARKRLQGEWLPFSRFDHRKHLEGENPKLTCETCHVRARASKATADVLVPGKEVCGGCHGDGNPPGSAEPRPGGKECRDCHRYHPPKAGGAPA